MLRIAVLVSGSGSNLQAIIDNIKNGVLNCSIEAVISDRKNAYAITRAKESGIATHVLEREIYGDNLSQEIVNLIKGKVDYIVLAGYLSILKGELLQEFENKIINIHPSLIPSFCGKGLYGMKVHEAAIEYGVKVSGCTVHFVDSGTDTGPIILQKTVQVQEKDNAEALQKRILVEEHIAIVEAIEILCKGTVRVQGRKVVTE